MLHSGRSRPTFMEPLRAAHPCWAKAVSDLLQEGGPGHGWVDCFVDHGAGARRMHFALLAARRFGLFVLAPSTGASAVCSSAEEAEEHVAGALRLYLPDRVGVFNVVHLGPVHTASCYEDGFNIDRSRLSHIVSRCRSVEEACEVLGAAANAHRVIRGAIDRSYGERDLRRCIAVSEPRLHSFRPEQAIALAGSFDVPGAAHS
jgi:hypothetical protein